MTVVHSSSAAIECSTRDEDCDGEFSLCWGMAFFAPDVNGETVFGFVVWA